MEELQKKADSIFVKVDGYRIILQDLEGTKQIIENLKEAISVLNRVTEVKEKSVSAVIDNIARLNEKLISISSQLPDVREPILNPIMSQQMPSQGIIKDTVNDLRGELETLKNDLSKIR